MMMYNDGWWCIWWYMMVYDDYMMIHDDTWHTIHGDVWWCVMMYDDTWWNMMQLLCTVIKHSINVEIIQREWKGKYFK